MVRVERAIWLIVDIAIFCAVFGMVVLIVLQVVSRLAGSSFAWTEELARFLFIWTIWLGMASGFRRGYHPSLSLLSPFMPVRIRPALRLLTPLCAVLFFGLVGRYGYDLLLQQIRFGEISPILQVGMWLATLPLLFGCALAILGSLVRALEFDPYVHPNGEVDR